jgi:hypothetical protein
MRMLITLVLALALTACHTNYRQPKTDEFGYLPIGNDAEVKVTVNHGVDTNQFRKTLYVSSDMHGIIDWYGYQDYVMEAFRQLDFFDEVITRPPTLYVNTTPPIPTKSYDANKKWYDMVDPVSMRDIVKQYGPNVLVAKTLLRSKSDDFGNTNAFYFQLQLIDPNTSRVVFQGSKSGDNTLGIDNNVINPVLNYAKGYLLYYDPTFVMNHNPSRGIEDDMPATPFSYRGGM